jgi:NDP-sugar pyrophosphorylase family protein
MARNATPLAGVTALILCGGLGTRLRPALGRVPKVLAPVAGRPFLDYQLDYLQSQGIADVILCTGHGADRVEEFCGSGARWGARIRSARETTLLGTAGAIKNADRLALSDPFVVVNGDSLVAAELGGMLTGHRQRRPLVTVALTEVPDRSSFGAVVLADDGTVQSFEEKGGAGTGLVSAGLYVMSRAVLDLIPPDRPMSLERDLFPRLAPASLLGWPLSGPFLDIGTVARFAQAPQFLARWPFRQRSQNLRATAREAHPQSRGGTSGLDSS